MGQKNKGTISFGSIKCRWAIRHNKGARYLAVDWLGPSFFHLFLRKKTEAPSPEKLHEALDNIARQNEVHEMRANTWIFAAHPLIAKRYGWQPLDQAWHDTAKEIYSKNPHLKGGPFKFANFLKMSLMNKKPENFVCEYVRGVRTYG